MSFTGAEGEEPSGTVSRAQLAALHRALEHALALIDGLRKPD
jgi:hypothetical protein